MNNTSTQYFSLARTGLLFGLKALGLKSGDKILIPDFLCDVVFKPLKKLGLEILKYQLKDSFVPEWSTIESIIVKEKVKNLLIVHFFGQPQEIDIVLLFKKKYNLKIIEDNSHGFSGKMNQKLLGTFGDIGISSPRKILGYPYGGVLYYNSKIKLNISSLSNFKNSFFGLIMIMMKINLSHFPKIRTKVKSIKNKSIIWSDPKYFKESKYNDCLLDNYSYRKIKSKDWSVIGEKRRENWIKWSNFIIKNNLKLAFKDIHKESCPWALPAYAKDIEERNYWLNWGIQNGVNIFPWPTLVDSEIKEKGVAFSRWERLLCFPLDINP